MPTVFQTFNKKTGKPHARWRFKYLDWTGKRKTATGCTTKTETIKLANQIEADQDAIRKGYRPPPTPAMQPRLFAAAIKEYIAWGESQGGYGGRPWSEEHAKFRRNKLTFWQERLLIEQLSELNGSLPRVEEVLQEIQKKGRAGTTLQHYAEALTAFCHWAVERVYLNADPLKNLTEFNTTPRVRRRAPTIEEIRAILAAAPPMRRLLYLVALASGLRRNELSCLHVWHLDIEHGGLLLESKWTKARKDGFQPLCSALISELAAISKGKGPQEPLLEVPHETWRIFKRDLDAAGIPKLTAEGKLDFHALRTGYATYVIEAGANAKEAQTLARHATPEMTLNVYARTRSARLAELAESVGSTLMAACPTGVQPAMPAVSADNATPDSRSDNNGKKGEKRGGVRPHFARIPGMPQLGQSGSFLGRQSAQTGQQPEVAKDCANINRTQDVVSLPGSGQMESPTDVQRQPVWTGIISGCFGFSGCSSKPLAARPESGFSGFSGIGRHVGAA